LYLFSRLCKVIAANLGSLHPENSISLQPHIP
jgi:hypothetical protein